MGLWCILVVTTGYHFYRTLIGHIGENWQSVSMVYTHVLKKNISLGTFYGEPPAWLHSRDRLSPRLQLNMGIGYSATYDLRDDTTGNNCSTRRFKLLLYHCMVYSRRLSIVLLVVTTFGLLSRPPVPNYEPNKSDELLCYILMRNDPRAHFDLPSPLPTAVKAKSWGQIKHRTIDP